MRTGNLITRVSTQLHFLPTSFFGNNDYYDELGRLRYHSGGHYWESDAYTAAGARCLFFNTTNLNPQYSSSKGTGLTLRCLVRYTPKIPS